MSLTNLLDATDEDILALKDNVKDGTLHIAVHPGYSYFRRLYKNKELSFEEHIDLCIKDMMIQWKIYESLSEYKIMLMGHERDGIERQGFVFSEPNINKFRLTRTINLMATLLNFIDIYDTFEQLEYLEELSNEKSPLILILPKGSLSKKIYSQYMDVLEKFIDPKAQIFYLESETYDRGYLHSPYPDEYNYGGAQKRDDIRDKRKINSVEKMYKLLDISQIEIFGDYIYRCMKGTYDSLNFCRDKPPFSINPNYSIIRPHQNKAEIEALVFNRTWILHEMGEKNYKEFCNAVNVVLQTEFDPSLLKEIISQPLEKKFEVLKSYKPMISALQEMKRRFIATK